MSATPAALPALIATYQAAHDQHDIDGALGTFAEDATVHDEDHDWVGAEEIRSWLIKTSNEYTFTRTLIDVSSTGDGHWLVRNRLEGNFPGGVVDLRYDFTLDDEHISRLSIAP